MKQNIETLVNLWYGQWLNTHEPYEDDFDAELYKALPNLIFTQDGLQFYLIGKI